MGGGARTEEEASSKGSEVGVGNDDTDDPEGTPRDGKTQ